MILTTKLVVSYSLLGVTTTRSELWFSTLTQLMLVSSFTTIILFIHIYMKIYTLMGKLNAIFSRKICIRII